ncbi:hypothetical protein SI65_07880 [Aspergillus cristatus]|uniref:Uncharacterized protein n=1 Tax=Aspergillus cristatus TaxID=573508 RepID=A0A1E3B7G4_ASPCR|nr:hypothetical protein SI65_07880 [Aspergillus cristatus]
MWSGLEKPGAIPFLALVVFSLLSLVPSLSWDWGSNWKNEWYVGGHRNEVRPIGAEFSRIVKDGSVDTRLRVRATSGQCWPWLCGDSLPRSRPAAVPSSFETASVLPNDAPTVYPWKNASTLTRSVRAFTAFIQQLDDRQLLPSFSTRSVFPVETALSHPSSNLSDVSSSPLHPLRDDSFEPMVYDNNYTTLMTKKTDTTPRLQFCDRFSDAWQQACHTVHDTAKTFSFSYDAIDSTHLPNSSMHPPVSLPSDTHQRKPPLPHNESEPTVAPKTIPSANAAAVLSGDSQDAGSGRNPKQVRGSCMAIVIGLVVGIMWF